MLGGRFSAFLSAGKKVVLSAAGGTQAECDHPHSPNTLTPPHPPPKKELRKWLCLYGVIIVQAVSVVTNDSKYMVLQDQERAQGLLNMAVKVKQALVFKEQHGVLFIFAPN